MQQQQQQQQYYPSQHQGAWMQQAHSYSAAGKCLAAALLQSNASMPKVTQEASPVRVTAFLLTFLPEKCTIFVLPVLAHP